MKKRVTRVLSFMMCAALAVGCLAGCGSKDPVVQESSSGAADSTSTSAGTADDSTFTYALAGDPGETVNVITTADRYGLMTLKLAYSPLFMYNADGINWFLAKDYETEDNKTYTFHLRDDVQWSDGEKFTADDVVFTYTEMEKEENLGWGYSQLVYDNVPVEINKVDDYTVSFTFPYETVTGLEMLSQMFIMPEHIYKDVTDLKHNDYNMNSVGTGPYKIVEYQQGSYVKFEANDTYFKGAPAIKNVVYRIIENSDTAILALQSGEIDAYQATPAEVQKLDMTASSLTAYPYSEGRVGYLEINENKIPDQKVRQAIFYALNKADMNQAAFLSEEYYLTPDTFLPISSEFYSDDVEKYTQDAEKAKQLLAEAGVSGLTVKLGYIGTDPAQSTQALLIQEQLGAAGITVELVSSDGTALSAQMQDPNNDYDMYLGGYIMGIDPDTFSSLFESTAAYNYTFSQNSTIDDLFKQGREETDTEKRKAIYADLQAAIQEEANFYPICSNNKILVINNRIKGVEEAGLVPVYTFEDTSYLKITE